MKKSIRIIQSVVLSNLPSESDFEDTSVTYLIYEIRKCKVALDDKIYEVAKFNSHGQAYIEEYMIWMNQGEYEFC